MRWVDQFFERLDESLEWKSLGKLSYRYVKEESLLMIAPAPLEISGGADDGESVYPFFTVHISHLNDIFDEQPEIMWDTMENELSLEGKIGGEDAWVILQREPFDDDEPEDVFDSKDGLRKKKPPQIDGST